MGIRVRFVLILGMIGILSLVGIGFASKEYSNKISFEEAKAKGEIIFSYINSIDKFFTETSRPLVMELVEQDRFYPELMSSFRMNREIYSHFSKKLRGYVFKQASLNPLQSTNKADRDEVKLINAFANNLKLTKQEGEITKGSEQFYYLAQPVTIDESCLHCHGNPQDAPKDQVDIYGTESGYNWEAGTVNSANVIYISLKKAKEEAERTWWILMGAGAIGLFVTLFGVWWFLDHKVVQPIIQLSNRTVDISLGKNIDEGIKSKSKDEIGTLAQAVERLRVSIVKMMRRRG